MGQAQQTRANSDQMQPLNDWKEPRSCRAFTGYIRGPHGDPGGTVLHCVANSAIPCNSREVERCGKGHVSLTILGIKNIGWAYAPWKKPKANAKSVKDPSAKPLFEQGAMEESNGFRVIKEVKMFSFQREGTFDKGPRDDEACSVLTVGETIHFKIHDFMFEDRSKGESMFPKDVQVIPEYSVVEVVVSPGDLKASGEGWGLKINRISLCSFSLHSYLHPLGLGILPEDYTSAEKLAESASGNSGPIRNMVERKNVAFFAMASKSSYVVQGEPGWLRIVGGDEPVIPAAQEIDIRQEDLLRFTNAGSDLGYALFLVDMASASGSLGLYVTYNEFYHKQAPHCLPFRCVPLINTEKLLQPIDPSEEVTDLPYEMERLTDLFVALDKSGVTIEGGEDKACKDFSLSSATVDVEGAYALKFGDSEQDEICVAHFTPGSGPSPGKTSASGRVDYRSLKAMRA